MPILYSVDIQQRCCWIFLNNSFRKYILGNLIHQYTYADMCLNILGGVWWFSTLDLQSGYWQTGPDEPDIHKTAFITKYRLFEYMNKPFGSVMLQVLFSIMQNCPKGFAMVHSPDISILHHFHWQKYVEESPQVGTERGWLKEAGLILKLTKCTLFHNNSCSLVIFS